MSDDALLQYKFYNQAQTDFYHILHTGFKD